MKYVCSSTAREDSEAMPEAERARSTASTWRSRDAPGTLGGASFAGRDTATTVRVDNGRR